MSNSFSQFADLIGAGTKTVSQTGELAQATQETLQRVEGDVRSAGEAFLGFQAISTAAIVVIATVSVLQFLRTRRD